MEEPTIRQHAEYKTSSKERFLRKLSFQTQFDKLYVLRYQILTNRIRKRIIKDQQYNGIPIVTKISEIPRQGKCILLGILVKPMKFKPNVLQQYSTNMIIDGSKLETKKEGEKKIDESDRLLLEDVSHDRIEIQFPGNPDFKHDYVNGIIVGALGAKMEKYFDISGGKLIVPGTPNQSKLMKFPLNNNQPNKFVAFVSGLGVNVKKSTWFNIQIALDYLSGSVGSKKEIGMVSSQVVRLVIAGNGIHPKIISDEEKFCVKGSLSGPEQTSNVQDIKYLDEMYSHVGQTLPLDVMPGQGDPTNLSLPQQPLHRCFFPKATKYRQTISFVTNPHEFTIDGVKFFGTSGQNINNIRTYSRYEKGLEIMEKTLEWNHIAPTCPDTLECHPFNERDELVIDYAPHVYFVGNQDVFEWKILNGEQGQKLLILCIPSFILRPSLCLVNLKNLDVKIIDIKVPKNK